MIPVADFMTKDLVTVREADDLALAESLLRLGGIRHLPVVRDGKLVGILTQRDVLRSGLSGKPSARDVAVSG
jgi:CBS domain-containing protein